MRERSSGEKRERRTGAAAAAINCPSEMRNVDENQKKAGIDPQLEEEAAVWLRLVPECGGGSLFVCVRVCACAFSWPRSCFVCFAKEGARARVRVLGSADGSCQGVRKDNERRRKGCQPLPRLPRCEKAAPSSCEGTVLSTGGKKGNTAGVALG